jgi:hypothetical protein
MPAIVALNCELASKLSKRDEHFLERNARLAQQHPGAHGPGGVVLVADVELEHGSPAEEKGPQKSGPLCGNALRLV